MLEENTPSGTGKTALDKFVMHYTAQGYTWEIINDGIIFRKPDSTLFADAVIDPDTGYITGYQIHTDDWKHCPACGANMGVFASDNGPVVMCVKCDYIFGKPFPSVKVARDAWIEYSKQLNR